MKDLCKYNLSSDLAIVYLKSSLDEVNILSKYLLHLVDFKNGRFFTYLPKKTDEEKIYDFTKGNIGGNSYETSANIIFNLMCNHRELHCCIDDVIRRPSDPYVLSCEKEAYFFESEVYYLMQNENKNIDVILKYLQKTDAIWHSLCVLTEAKFDISKAIKKEEIQEICLKAWYVIIGAYDGEGYVFWKKNELDMKPIS